MRTRRPHVRRTCATLALVACAWAAAAPARATEPPAPAAPRRVLLLHSFHAGYPWTDQEDAGVRRALARAPVRVELYVEYLDARRFPALARGRLPALEEKYAHVGLDVAVVTDNDALELALAARGGVLRGVPIVFCGINSWDPAMLGGARGVTGVAEDVDVGGTLDAVALLHPDATELVVVVGASRTGAANRALFERAAARRALAAPARIVVEPAIDALAPALVRPGARPVVLLLGPVRDEERHVLEPEASAERLARLGVPLYSQWDFYLGHGVLGGMITDGAGQGRAAGELALRILGGEDPDAIPVVRQAATRLTFEHAALARAGIPDAALPAGSVVVLRPPSFLAEHGRVLVAASAVIVALAVAVLVLALLVRRARRAERALAASSAELARVNAGLERSIEEAVANVKTLRGLLPICASCKKIRDDRGYWNRIEAYVSKHSDAQFTHGICPECAERLYPGMTGGPGEPQGAP